MKTKRMKTTILLAVVLSIKSILLVAQPHDEHQGPQPIPSLMSIKKLVEHLLKNDFMRVHRSFVVNLNKITTVERNRIIFGKVYIPVSDQYHEQFQHYLDQKFLR